MWTYVWHRKRGVRRAAEESVCQVVGRESVKPMATGTSCRRRWTSSLEKKQEQTNVFVIRVPLSVPEQVSGASGGIWTAC